MDNVALEYHLDNLKVQDPNYVVDVLGITSEQLLEAFPREALRFIEEEY